MPTLDEVLGVVAKWEQEKIRSAPLSQFTPAFNQVSTACTELKAQLTALYEPPQQQPIDEKE